MTQVDIWDDGTYRVTGEYGVKIGKVAMEDLCDMPWIRAREVVLARVLLANGFTLVDQNTLPPKSE